MIVEFVIVFVIGVILGVVWSNATTSAVGTLVIDESNPLKDVYKFEVKDLDSLSKRKRVILKVQNNGNVR